MGSAIIVLVNLEPQLLLALFGRAASIGGSLGNTKHSAPSSTFGYLLTICNGTAYTS